LVLPLLGIVLSANTNGHARVLPPSVGSMVDAPQRQTIGGCRYLAAC
jgi:hypothetical protein